MMEFDVRNRIYRLRMIRYMDRLRISYERFMYSRMKIVLLSIYKGIARRYRDGETNWEVELADTRSLSFPVCYLTVYKTIMRKLDTVGWVLSCRKI